MTVEAINIPCQAGCIQVYRKQPIYQDRPTVLALHGFLGSGLDFECLWDASEACVNWVAVDLLGHGKTKCFDERSNWRIGECIEILDTVIAELTLKQIVLLGYSMGGRIGMHYCLHRLEQIVALVLVGATPGIVDKESRLQRQKEDAKLGEFLKTHGVKAFWDMWSQKPLIQTQQNIASGYLQKMESRRLLNDSKGLARVLSDFSPGVLPSLWDDLERFNVPVLCIAGASDKKFISIAEKMKQALPQSMYAVVPEVGHACHLEGPVVFWDVCRKFIERSV